MQKRMPHYDPLVPQNASRAAELRTQYEAHRKATKIDFAATSKISRLLLDSSEEEMDSM